MKLHVGSVKRNRNIQSSVGTLDSAYTDTRAHTPTTATSAVVNSSSTFIEYAQNVPRFRNGALYVEETRTNVVQNPRGENPILWTGFFSPIGRGVENGLDYVDIQFSGGGAVAFAGTFATTVVATAGDVSTLSMHVRMIAGNMTNVTSLQLNALYRNSVPATVGDIDSDVTALIVAATTIGGTRISHTTTAPAATVEKFPRFKWTTTGAYDFTLRFAGVQFEAGAYASSIILPVKGGAAVTTRAADAITRSIAPTGYPTRNMYQRSEDLSNAIWVKGQTTINSAVGAGPYTGTLADGVVATATTSTHTVGQPIATALYTPGNRYCISIYAKAGTLNFMRISNNSTHMGGISLGFYFDLTTGAVTVAGNQPAAANLVTTATSIGGGWWRCSLTYTLLSQPAATSSFTFQFTPTTASNSYLGDVTEGGRFWGAQFTQSDVVPAYIQTVASSAASHSKGTLVIADRFTRLLATGGFPIIAGIHDDASNFFAWIHNPAISSLELIGTVRGVSFVDSQFSFISGPVLDQVFRLALSWDTSTGVVSAQAHNGTTLSAVFTLAMDLMPVFNTLGIGSSPAGTTLGTQEFSKVFLYQNAVPAASLYQLIAA